jgi:hypothetical protein
MPQMSPQPGSGARRRSPPQPVHVVRRVGRELDGRATRYGISDDALSDYEHGVYLEKPRPTHRLPRRNSPTETAPSRPYIENDLQARARARTEHREEFPLLVRDGVVGKPEEIPLPEQASIAPELCCVGNEPKDDAMPQRQTLFVEGSLTTQRVLSECCCSRSEHRVERSQLENA